MVVKEGESKLPVLTVAGSWEDLLQGKDKPALEALLPEYLLNRRWFGGKAQPIRSVTIAQTLPIPQDFPQAFLTLIRVEYEEGKPETYRLPLVYIPSDESAQMKDAPGAIARVVLKGAKHPAQGIVRDAMWVESFLESFFGLLARESRYSGPFGEITATPTRAFDQILQSTTLPLKPSPMKAEQSNTSVVYGKHFILKLYRRAEEGINPDLEIGRFLTERGFPCIAAVASALEHCPQGGEPSTVALLQRFLPNKGDAWTFTLESLGHYLAKATARRQEIVDELSLIKSLGELARETLSTLALDLIGAYLETAALLGRRTGELHLALSSDTTDPNFSPERVTDVYTQGLFQSVHGLIASHFRLLRQRLERLPASVQKQARAVLDLETMAMTRAQSVRDRQYEYTLIRCHGDYHLGQVLYTGDDFVIIDFEGEPARPLSVRRMKGSALRDVAGMLRSFHYAANAAIIDQTAGRRADEFEALEPLALFWYRSVAAAYLRAYLVAAGAAPFLPTSQDASEALLEMFLLEKAAYELGYELNNRPDWVRIPLQGILQLVGPSA